MTDYTDNSKKYFLRTYMRAQVRRRLFHFFVSHLYICHSITCILSCQAQGQEHSQT